MQYFYSDHLRSVLIIKDLHAQIDRYFLQFQITENVSKQAHE